MGPLKFQVESIKAAAAMPPAPPGGSTLSKHCLAEAGVPNLALVRRWDMSCSRLLVCTNFRYRETQDRF